MDPIYILAVAFFVISLIYSSVGFGGGSSYLVLLALFFVSIPFIRTTALLCNIIVVTGSVIVYYQKGYIHLKKFLPFLITSVPLAFFGARFRLSEHIYFIILGSSLIVASTLLFYKSAIKTKAFKKITYPKYISWLLGGLIGFVAGLVGIGGGIFLSPVLNLMKWDRSVKIAALASLFILVNSLSGLVGLYTSNNFEFNLQDSLLLLGAVLLGGQIGIRMSLKWLNGNKIRFVTATLILLVAVRILVEHI